MIKPWHSLCFAAACFAEIAILSLSFPSDGVTVAQGWTLRFPNVREAFTPKQQSEKAKAAILRLDKLDTTITAAAPKDTTVPQAAADATVLPRDSATLITSIQNNGGKPLAAFFESLDQLQTDQSSIRVLHYGDSQIEGDRISDYLRMKLQGRFGGSGPGLISPMPISQSMINRITTAQGWDRYTIFTVKDSRVSHNNFGVLAGFCRFAPYKQLSDTSSVVTSSMQVITTKFGGSNAMQYSRVRMFYGGAKKTTWCEMYDGATLSGADSLKAGGNFNYKDFEPTKGSNTHVFKFAGKDSPDIYGISLETPTGIMIDNIGMRGSSGTFFHLINQQQMKDFFRFLNTKLIILQFGGNAMPAVKDAAGAAAYGSYVRYQLQVLKKLAPGVSILFIGPSDMSTKVGTSYETLPFLEDMRDAIKKAVFDNGCAFFDMYDCMGGKNSMPVWVDQKLAATDYTHFSPQGARKIAILLYTAIMNDYALHVNGKKK